jgi:uncharacterized protein (DUF2062 family)
MLEALRRRIISPLLGLLREGLAPRDLALCIALGSGFGIFPVLGVSTPVLTAIALLRKLNLVAIQLASWLIAPVQLVLIIPFMRLGEWLTDSPAQPLTVEAGMRILGEGVLQAIVTLWDAIVHATLGWIVVAPIAIFLLYRLLTPILTAAADRLSGPDR